MKYLVFFLLALAGCASQPVPVVQIDAKCDKLAKYVRAMITLKEIGVSPKEDWILNPKAVNAPFRLTEVQHEAYAMKVNSPDEGYTVTYKMCADVGYQVTLKQMGWNELERIEEARVMAEVMALQPPMDKRTTVEVSDGERNRTQVFGGKRGLEKARPAQKGRDRAGLPAQKP